MTQPLTIIHRIQNAVTKIGTSNGTQILEPEYGGEDKSNSAREAWFDQWAAIKEFLIASKVKKTAEDREEKAKERLKATFSQALAKLNIGDKSSVARSNVSVEFSLRNGQRRINRATVISVLSSDEYKWKFADINNLLDKIDLAGKPALYISTSTTAE